MSTVDLFRQYAEDALRQAVQSKNEKEQLALIELVQTWTESAEANERQRDGIQLKPRRPQESPDAPELR
jgi:site-specific recombinase